MELVDVVWMVKDPVSCTGTGPFVAVYDEELVVVVANLGNP